MDIEGSEFQDWEVLRNSDELGPVDPPPSVENIRELEGIEGASEGIVQSNYFSLDSDKKYAKNPSEGDVSEAGSVESDNPSWIDPVPETQYPRKEPSVFWSDSSSDRSEDRKFSDFGAKNELGFAEIEKSQHGFEGHGEIGTGSENPGKFWPDSGEIESVSMEFKLCRKNREVGFLDNGNSQGGSAVPGEEKEVEGLTGEGEEAGADDDVATEVVKSCDGEGKQTVVWWKLPLELLKYCALKVSPVWTFSLAAAVIGFVILARRLYKLRRKSRSLPLKVTVDDKKVSQFMTKAARLNEAFSVVKRVPVVRPSLPAAGLAQWPVMSLR